MDILAARKKAAERAKAVKPAEKPETTPVVVPSAEPVAPPREPGQRAAAEVVQSDAPERTEQPIAAPAALSGEAAQVQPMEPERDLEMLSALLGSEEYAIPVERVREVLTPREITPVPHTPSHILGVCSLRGTVLPIVDLKQRLGLPKTELDEKTRIIVAGVEDDELVGLLVDRVRGVVRFPADAVRPAPETVEKGAEYLSGIVRQDDRLIILLDVLKATAL